MERMYTCNWNNKQLVKVDRFYPSSQLCSNCRYKNIKLKSLNIRQWKCECCGTLHDRDVNAAINILKYNPVRNTVYSCGGVNKPNGIPVNNSVCLGSEKVYDKEAIIKLKVLQD